MQGYGTPSILLAVAMVDFDSAHVACTHNILEDPADKRKVRELVRHASVLTA